MLKSSYTIYDDILSCSYILNLQTWTRMGLCNFSWLNVWFISSIMLCWSIYVWGWEGLTMCSFTAAKFNRRTRGWRWVWSRWLVLRKYTCGRVPLFLSFASFLFLFGVFFFFVSPSLRSSIRWHKKGVTSFLCGPYLDNSCQFLKCLAIIYLFINSHRVFNLGPRPGMFDSWC